MKKQVKRKRGRPSKAEIAARKRAEQKDLALIISMYVGLFIVIAFCVNLALADEMVFKFKSPSFSGQNTSQHYLTIENQEHTRYETLQEEIEALVEQAERDKSNTTTARFIRNFETRVYAKLSQQLVDRLFGEESQDSGTILLEGNTIDYTVDSTNIKLTVTNEDGSQTVITFPLNSFKF
tara:strand:+ start:168 stop:707 length:540 start_codon:yes stop_codon:yes gene_type:complete